MLHDVDRFLYVFFDFLLWCQYETGCRLEHMLSQQLQALRGKATPVGFEPMQEGHLPSCCMMLTASYMFSSISCYGVSMKQVAS